MTKKTKHVVVFGEPDRPVALFEICAGFKHDILSAVTHDPEDGHMHFHVLAESFAKAMEAVFEHVGAKTSDDLPQPFSMRSVDTPKVLVIL